MLSSGALRVGSALPGDTGRYRCVPARQRGREQVHHVVVVFMPTVSVDYRFVYRVPMCDEMRMSQKVPVVHILMIISYFNQLPDDLFTTKKSDDILHSFCIAWC